MLIALSGTQLAANPVPRPGVVFGSFEYTGTDEVFSAPLAPGHYRNPILAGFYPDPDICRVGDDYYIVNSSFAYFPGIPVFHSRDLVNWTQIGNVVDRARQLDYRGLGVSRGIFAPAIGHYHGLFYVVCTFVDGGGNFLMTANDAAGPWSDPVWLGFDGIDPSLFFDDDGKAWLVNNGPPPNDRPLYEGHRAIYLQELDLVSKRLFGPRVIIVNGGANPVEHPIWIEGPHIVKKDGWYYLICAEGGTEEQHSEVVFRSRSVTGPFIAGPANPILTQRDLPGNRRNPVTSTGHAALLEAHNGEWWAVFLGCRPYEDNKFNTGRETFMLPVTWSQGWPSILSAGKEVPYTVPSPGAGSLDPTPPTPLTGNFTWRDDFAGTALSPLWMGLRGIPEVALGHGLRLVPNEDTLSGSGNPAFIGRRIQHAHFVATISLDVPSQGQVSAGLVAFQNETHHYFFGVRRAKQGSEIFIERQNGGLNEAVARASLGMVDHIELRLSSVGPRCDFQYSNPAGGWTVLLKDADATLLSTEAAGGFVGALVGVHARLARDQNPTLIPPSTGSMTPVTNSAAGDAK